MKTTLLKLLILGVYLIGRENLVFSQSNHISNLNQYPLDDPRNPNCPCHQYQKLAEQQYLSNINQVAEEKNNFYNQNVSFNLQQSFNIKEPSTYTLNRKKKFFSQYLRKLQIGKTTLCKFFQIRKYGRKSKRQRDVNICFYWG